MSVATPGTLGDRDHDERADLAHALSALRGRLWLVAILLGVAGLAWWSTADRMAGMDAGPGTDLGALGWFIGVWVVMMAAMMFPSLVPTVALYARMSRRRAVSQPLLFAAGYLFVWSVVGLLAYGLYRLGRDLLGAELAWSEGGRWVAAGFVALAAVYELTPMKGACLANCRRPLAFLLAAWRDRPVGALQMGSKHGAWCLGCCWAMMAALFALGVMSLTWMVLVAALIALQKTLPWRRAVIWSTAFLLLGLAVAMATVPHDVPGLVVPGTHAGMHAMSAMH